MKQRGFRYCSTCKTKLQKWGKTNAGAPRWRAQTEWCWQIIPRPTLTGEVYQILLLDDIRVGNLVCLIVRKPQYVIAWTWGPYETGTTWDTLLGTLSAPVVVVCDGQNGILVSICPKLANNTNTALPFPCVAECPGQANSILSDGSRTAICCYLPRYCSKDYIHPKTPNDGKPSLTSGDRSMEPSSGNEPLAQIRSSDNASGATLTKGYVLPTAH